jgi:hypothetical protein
VGHRWQTATPVPLPATGGPPAACYLGYSLYTLEKMKNKLSVHLNICVNTVCVCVWGGGTQIHNAHHDVCGGGRLKNA